MEDELRRRVLMEAPSFRESQHSTAEPPETVIAGGRELFADDFEFAFASVDSDDVRGMIADEIFSNGHILPVYPVFNPNLVAGGFKSPEMEKSVSASSSSSMSSSSMSSEAEDLDELSVATAAYCLWTPRSAPQTPERWRKSSSTGSLTSSSRWCRFRDLILGRSRSDGKEKFVVLPALEEKEKEKAGFICRRFNGKSPAAAAAGESEKGKVRAVKEMDIVTAHRIYYSKGRASGCRRSFLPYRPEILVGFFRNGGRHPF